jgi:hypothetical protein
MYLRIFNFLDSHFLEHILKTVKKKNIKIE